MPWVLSARSPDALRAQAQRLRAHVADDAALDPLDVGFSLAHRPLLEDRAVVLGADREELLRGAGALARGERAANVIEGSVAGEVGGLAFLFTGQGAQRVGMGRELYERLPVFRTAFEQACAQLSEHLDRSLLDVVFGEGEGGGGGAELLDETRFTQAGLFALEVALFRLLESWNVRPGLMMGHSVGELAAAHVAGVLSLRDACRLVAARGRLMGGLPAGGAMVSVRASEQEVLASLEGLEGQVALAAVNAPGSVVVSGDEVAVLELAGAWETRGHKTKRLRVSHAFHSPRMDGMLGELTRVAEGLSFGEPRPGVVSNVTGEVASAEQLRTPAYWARHARETVRFADGVRQMWKQGVRSFLELGPDGVLSAMVEECLEDERDPLETPLAAVPALRPGRDEERTLCAGLAAVWVQGVEVDWAERFRAGGAERVELPTYAFQRERYWLHTEWTGGSSRAREQRSSAEGWRYRMRWTPVRGSGTEPAGTWLVVVPAMGSGDRLVAEIVAALAARGAQPLTVEVDRACADRAGLAGSLRAALAGEDVVGGVLSLLALGADGSPVSEEGWGGAVGSLTLVQALGDAGVAAPLWCVTRGGVSVSAEDRVVSPAAGLVWGLGRVVGLEEPGRWGGLVDLPPEPDERAFERLCEVLGDGRGESEVAVRAAGTFASRLVSAPPAAARAEGYAPRGTVLVTGGTGALGGHVARWLAECGAEHLLLTSRRGLDAPGAPELVEELEGLGASVSVVACDVADCDELERVLAGVSAEHPLDAVFHAAGTLDDGPLDGLSAERLEGVLRAKADAAWHLHELTRERDLSAFVLFSSIAGTLGSGGQGAYAAGNAFLDSLAEFRRGRGLPATSVAWGAWAGAGMAAGGDEHLGRRGIRAMPAGPALEALRDAIEAGEGRVVVADLDWERYALTYSSARARPLIGELPEVKRVLREAAGGLGGSEAERGRLLAERLAHVPEGERERAVRELVVEHAAAVLGLSSPEAVRAGRSFRELGFDSLAGVELARALRAATGLRLPVTVVFDYPTPVELARFLLRELTGERMVVGVAAQSVTGLDEPIAIVGMSCRYPGPAHPAGTESTGSSRSVRSPEELWELLAAGGDAIGEFPVDRGWDLEGLYDPDPDRSGTSYARRGGFLYDAGEFDAAFFGIGPREALAMDPQQRLLLEVCWEAIEGAGIDPASLRETLAGTFIGVGASGYGIGAASGKELEGYRLTGSIGSIVSGRIAYTFGLEGPAVSIDTACSSSLVALHWACQSLRTGECSLALAGGVAVMALPDAFVEFSRQRGLAPDGRCKSFGEAADGTGWSEGAGVLLLERLGDARRAGHEVLGVLRGSAVNQDGASNGLTAPNGPSQQRVIMQALANAGLQPGEVDAVEAHGTGTTLGDPIEAQALLATYGRDREDGAPLWLGSVKSNIGHAAAAAGVAGVIKMVMALRNERLPRTLHAERPSSQVDWSAGAVELLTEERPWRTNGRPRRAGVSSFGVSGTNAHVILEEAPPQGSVAGAAPPASETECDVLPLVLSGRGNSGLQAQAARLQRFLDGVPEFEMADVALSLTARAALEDRAVVLSEDRDELLESLAALAAGQSTGSMLRDGTVDGRVAFLFTGQGAQRVGMGRELHAAFPVFRDAFDEACGYLDQHLECSLRVVVFGERESVGAGRLDGTAFAQPALFALEVALFRLLEAWGVRPDFLIGHSVGELAAAHVAGLFSLPDACRLVAARGRLMGALPEGGAMAAIAASEEEMVESLAALEHWERRVALAAVNAPGSVVVSGDEDAVLELMGVWEGDGRRVKRLQVSHAFHSPRMEGMLQEFRRVVEEVSFGEPRIPLISNLSGGVARAEELCTAEYWVRHVRETVRFADGVRRLRAEGVSSFLELGPDGVLSALVGECVAVEWDDAGRDDAGRDDAGRDDTGQDNAGRDDAEPGDGDAPAAPRSPLGVPAVAVPALRSGQAEARSLMAGVGALWARGVSVDWARVLDGSGAKRVVLPSYPFQRERYWLLPSGRAGDAAAAGLERVVHPLLGAAVALADGDGWLFTGRLSLSTHPWLADHVVQGSTLLPGTAFLELALHAGEQVGCGLVRELVLEAPLVLDARPDDGEATQLQLAVGEPDAAGARTIEVYSRVVGAGVAGERGGAPWTRHARGVLVEGDRDAEDRVAAAELGGEASSSWPPPGAVEVDVDGVYDGLAGVGLEYGPVFQGLKSVWRRGAEVFAEVALAEEQAEEAVSFGIHPALLDAALHALAGDTAGDTGARLPFSWNGVRLHAAGATALRVRLAPADDGTIALVAADRDGTPVASAQALVLRPATADSLAGRAGYPRDSLFGIEWVAIERGAAEAAEEDELDDVVIDCPGGWTADVDGALERVGEMLTVLQGELADDRSATRRLVVVTRGAVSVGGEGVADPAAGGVWGLVRAAQAEHPGRLVLIDLAGGAPVGDAIADAVRSGESQVDGLAPTGDAIADALRSGEPWIDGLAPIGEAIGDASRSGEPRIAGGAPLGDAIADALRLGEPQIAVRDGGLFVPRMVRAGRGVGGRLAVGGGVAAERLAGGETEAGAEGGWRLGVVGGRGVLEDLCVVQDAGAGGGALGAGQVRVGVRAAGVNFRDVLITLGMYPGGGSVGGEGAGAVLEVGPGVEDLAPGDRVMGLLDGAFGSVAVSDRRLLARIPQGWSFTRAASVPIVFLTAYYALVDLGRARPRERLLVHAAAGGVGIAAVQLARHLGLEVFATASEGKWGVLEGMGIAGERIASSRTVEFGERFAQAGGVDLVLNSLAGEPVDVSLGLLGEGGRFLEMGKTDIRDASAVGEAFPEVSYRPFDLTDAGPDRIQEMLQALVGLFEEGVLDGVPVRVWDAGEAVGALRFMSQARHVGKNVLRIPAPPLAGEGTVLVTGGTGGLGGLVARHLASRHGVRRLLLASRRGPDAEGAGELVEELEALGASVRVAACDVAEREQVVALLEGIDSEHPLSAVVHAAGVVDDGLVGSLSQERLRGVLAPKVAGAWHLHELTEQLDLRAFVLFSSIAATFGGTGQAAYAAGNAFLDALASYRRSHGLAGSSLAWGPWTGAGMVERLGTGEREQMARAGVRALSPEQGLGLLDAACELDETLLLPVGLDMGRLRSIAREGQLPALMDELVRAPASRRGRAAAGRGGLAGRLAGLDRPERERLVVELVREHAAAVLGHASAEALDAGSAFKELGFDSLASVELRNRLSAESGLQLPATLVFDHPTPAALAAYLVGKALGERARVRVAARVSADLGEPIAVVGMSCRFPGPAHPWPADRGPARPEPAHPGPADRGPAHPEPAHPAGAGSTGSSGSVRSPEELWELLAAGGDAIGGFPADRGWDLERLYDPDARRSGSSYTREGGFLEGVGEFDAAFFGISPREALAMDPQQRLLLEICWEAIEGAGIDPATLKGTATGVFAGISPSGYAMGSTGAVGEDDVEGYLLTGNTTSVASGRVAYTFGLEGPAVSIDTACSSSLVALHLAASALRQGECTLALAGGVNVMATPGLFVEFSRQRGLAPDGRCKSFGDGADGTSWSEGAGILLLERLSDAQRSGREILGVLRGSAVNQDGASNGLTAPNGPSQQRVIMQALAHAGLSPKEIDAVEAHGTGTTLGDPIEAQALLATYGQGRPADAPLWLGSIKSNIGHAAAAAGVAGVIKMLLALRHGVLPRTLHAERPTTQVDWGAGAVALLTEERPWQANGRPRRAGISSFAVSGTNAHLIVEEAPPREPAPKPIEEAGGDVLPWIVSGRGERGLRAQAGRLREFLDGAPALDAAEIGLALAGRPPLEDRAVLVGNREELLEGLAALAAGGRMGDAPIETPPTRVTGGRLAFLFTGQGAQRVGMGRELYGAFPVFREAFDAACAHFDPALDRGLREAVLGEGELAGERAREQALDGTALAQPALFALEVALFRLMEEWGVRPDFLIGHSVGELAAAHVAGVFSLADACRLVAARGLLMGALPEGGAMAAIGVPEAEVLESLTALGDWERRVALAAVNSPGSVVVSGDEDAVAELLAVWEQRGARTRRLRVSHAFHSPRMGAMLEEFRRVAETMTFGEPRIPLVSNLSGGLAYKEELCTPDYWVRHVREPVRFADGVRWLRAEGVGSFLELGPDGALSAMVAECVEAEAEADAGDAMRGAPTSVAGTDAGVVPAARAGTGGVVPAAPAGMGAGVVPAAVVGTGAGVVPAAVPLLRAGRAQQRALLGALGELWVRGVAVDWSRVLGSPVLGSPAHPVRPARLPSYAFARERYWLNPVGPRADATAVGMERVEHPLLGAAAALADGEGWMLTGRLSLETHPWLADHVVAGVALLPGTALLELALHAGGQLGCGAVRELTLQAPLVLREGEGVQLQLLVGEPDESGARALGIHARVEGAGAERDMGGATWTRHAAGVLAPRELAAGEPIAGELGGEAWPPAGAVEVATDDLYDELAAAGLEYGPEFQGLRSVWRRGEELFAEVAPSERQQREATAFGLHPALLDAALHAVAAGATSDRDGGGLQGGPRLPFSWGGVNLHAAGAAVLRVRLVRAGGDALALTVADGEGRPVASVDSLALRAAPTGDIGTVRDALFAVEWVAVERGGDETVDEDGLGRVVDCTAGVTTDVNEALERVGNSLAALQGELADDSAARPVAVVTRGAVSVAGEGVADPAGGGVWGLVRAAQVEHPGRFVLVDVDGDGPARDVDSEGPAPDGDGVVPARDFDSEGPARDGDSERPAPDTDGAGPVRHAIAEALRLGEPQVAVRGGELFVPRLARAGVNGGLAVGRGVGAEADGEAGGWRLGVSDGGGVLEDLRVVSSEGAGGGELGVGEIRVAVRAAGVNFRDVLIALGMYPGDASVGSEGAGVVLECGPGVADLAVGDRVMGLLDGAFGSVAIADQRLLVRIPEGWSFARAASAPIVFLTAYYGLVDLAGAQEGERVLVHAAAGGVGIAAVQLARQLGLEVFATASEGKWGVLEELGLDREHIASSRSLEFGERFAAAGVDVVLNSLAGEYVDASAGLLGDDGRFLEMGKTDVRDAEEIEAAFPGVRYRAFDLMEAGPDRIQEMLRELCALFEAGALEGLPVRVWDAAEAVGAFRFMSQARHVGKNVLRIPSPALGSEGTVLVTGGTGGLGAQVARHLVERHGVRHLLLASRRGWEAEGAAELVRELEELGATVSGTGVGVGESGTSVGGLGEDAGESGASARGLREGVSALGVSVTVVACDVAERKQVKRLLKRIDAEHPLSAVVHAAGVLDDGLLDGLTQERLRGVLAPKAAGAWHLHELTKDLDLRAFVLFSSIAGTLGGAGQSAYAAANASLDALALHRRAQGLAATSLAWGPWAAPGMAEGLREADRERMARGGIRALSPEQGLELLDAALELDRPTLLPVGLDIGALRTAARERRLPLLLGELVRAPAARRAGPARARGSLARRLAALAPEERERAVVELVREHAAAVLGHASAQAVAPEQAFKDLGLDSLAAVELRNRLAAECDLRLPATLVFDHPTPAALARFLLAEAFGEQGAVRLPARAGATGELVAIVGMSCRYPGRTATESGQAGTESIRSPEELWELLAAGGDGIGGFPEDRGWDLGALYDPDPERPGSSYVLEGGFLAGADEFDAEFFGISPREALAMDPQQRLLLELSWEALERAGIDPLSLRGSETGVFAGVGSSGYGAGAPGGEELEGFLLTGSIASVVSGRVAYTFGLEGPAVSIDTACSSSLVALHLAAGALRQGECSLALAGGVSVMATPALFTEFSRQRGLAPDGRCKSFADAADGTGWSEGAGVLLLERLDDAQRNGHEVLAVLRGSAVNQDGASNGLTAPNGPSQQRVILQALANAGLEPGEVDAVEAHGTGTALGDPIEAQALLATYGRDRPAGAPLWLGSVKSNIGHAAAASGVAGVIKMLLALRHGVLPRTLHVERPTTQVDWSAGAVELLTEERSWEPGGRPRRAGVSSFGVSGTNAHVILEEAPALDPAPVSGNANPTHPGLATESGGSATTNPTPPPPPSTTTGAELLPWILSGRGERGLRAQAQRLREFLAGAPMPEVQEVGCALAARPLLEDRAVLLGDDREQLLAGLGALAAGEPASGVVRGRATGGRLALMFTGQGAQRVGMGRDLYTTFPAFRAAFDEICTQLDPHLGHSLREVMFGQTHSADAHVGLESAPELAGGELDSTALAQPALFALEVALYRLVEVWGVRPDFLIGHSVGELAAAHVAGVFSLADACRLVAARGRLMGALPAGGAMLAVAVTEEQALESLATIDGWQERVALAAVNAPGAVVISGEEPAVVELAQLWEQRGARTKRLRVSHAFHSPLMEGMLEELRQVAETVSFAEPRIPVISNVSGALGGSAEMCTAEYWVRHVREPVRFADGVRWLRGEGVRSFLELGPDGVLGAIVEECADAEDAPPPVTASLLLAGHPEAPTTLAALGAIWAHGAGVEWRGGFAASGARPAQLPPYAFRRDRYWLAAGAPSAGAALEDGSRFRAPWLNGAGEDSAAAAPSGDGGLLGERLAGVAEGERERVVLDLVREHAAFVLGYASAREVPAAESFSERGLGSLGAVRLARALRAVTGLQLPATVVFDYPTPAELARHLLAEASGAPAGGRVVARAAPRLGEPIAIVGVSCRYPGGASPVRSAEELWGLVASGGDGIGGFPADRGWDLEALYDPDPEHDGTSYSREGGFLYDAGEFDAPFFGISPREALAMDPQQRLLLELAWEALEDAGVDPHSLRAAPPACSSASAPAATALAPRRARVSPATA